MAQSTQGVQLVHSTDGTSYSKVICIKDFPDIDNNQPDQVEITTLCDDEHKNIDGLITLPDELSFTANYDDTDYATVQGIIDTDNGEGYWGVRIGNAGKKWLFKATARLVLVGAGVGDVLEMRIVLTPKSEITVS
jgi:hypothetical protein